MQDFRIRDFVMGDLERLIVLQNRYSPMHKLGALEFTRDVETLRPELQRFIQVATVDDEFIGFAMSQRYAGSYHPQKFMIEIAVEEPFRSRGIGSALLDAAEARLSEFQLLSLTAQVSESAEDSMKFVTNRGFIEQKRDFVSYLDVDAFDRSNWSTRVEGFEFLPFEELDTPAFRVAWYDAFNEVRPDIPRSAPPTPIAFDFFNEQIIEEPDFAPDLSYFVLENQQLVGFSGAFHNRDLNQVDQWLTAIRRPWRGKGLTLPLKVNQILGAKRLGIPKVQTDNDSRNTPMLRVNEQLGFEREPAVLSMCKNY